MHDLTCALIKIVTFHPLEWVFEGPYSCNILLGELFVIFHFIYFFFVVSSHICLQFFIFKKLNMLSKLYMNFGKKNLLFLVEQRLGVEDLNLWPLDRKYMSIIIERCSPWQENSTFLIPSFLFLIFDP